MNFYCETPDGECAHVNAWTASLAAEVFVQDLAGAGMIRPGGLTYVRVTDYRGQSPAVLHFEVEVEMTPEASALPCSGDECGFDDASPSAVVR